jgi:hypothetical protein
LLKHPLSAIPTTSLNAPTAVKLPKRAHCRKVAQQHETSGSRQSANQPVSILVAKFHRVLANHLAQLSVARGGQLLELETATGQRKYTDA